MIHTRKAFITYFRQEYMPGIREIERTQKGQGKGVDNPLRAETWNNALDFMLAERQVPRCAESWDNPFDLRK